MTAPLRKAHLRIWIAAAVVLIAVIGAALRWRSDGPGVNPVRWEDLR